MQYTNHPAIFGCGRNQKGGNAPFSPLKHKMETQIYDKMIRFDRLKQLADHLDFGQMGHAVFDYEVYNDSGHPFCGTAGCAIGECPIVWPNEWEWSIAGYPILFLGEMWSDDSGMAWFGLDSGQYTGLFSPMNGYNDYLGENPTRHDVAAHIRKFITENQ